MQKFQEGNITITNEDNMELMARYPDNYFELAIVDPPYGSGIMAKNKLQKHKTQDTGYRNKTTPDPSYFKELNRVSKHSIIWGSQYMIDNLNPEGSFIVWDKGANPDTQHMSACDIAWFSKRERIRKVYMHWCGAVKIGNEKTIHIHQKPVKLYEWLLMNYAKEGDKILDTHLGSGSIAIACHNLGFDLTACELDAEYYNASVKRLQQHAAQLTMF